MEIKFCDVVAFRTEDVKFPAENLLRGGKWLSEKNSRSSVNDITLHIGEARFISHIDVGNWGSSFITIEVSQVGLQRYQTLLPSTELMSGRDAQAKKNWTSVHMFSKEHFVEDVLEQKWSMVRVTCLQPFLQNEQFGLSFFKIFSITENELPVQPKTESPPAGSVFQMMRECALAKLSPLVVNRSQQLVLAAIDKQRTSFKCSSDSKEATVASSSNRRESSPVKTDIPLSKKKETTNILHDSAQKSLCRNTKKKNYQNCATTLQTNAQTIHKLSPTSVGSNKNIDSCLSQDRHRATSTANIQKHTPPCYAAGKTVETSRKRRRTPLVPSSDSENNISPVPKAACMRKASGKQLKLLQRHVNSSCDSHNKDQETADVILVSDSDSDSPSMIALHLATLSPSQEPRDVDSDSETAILPLDGTHEDIKEVVTLSSPERSSSHILSLDSDALPGPSRIACPLCSDYFDIYSIENHAATCDITSGTNDSICPICSRYFPPEILPQHADLCAERNRI